MCIITGQASYSIVIVLPVYIILTRRFEVIFNNYNISPGLYNTPAYKACILCYDAYIWKSVSQATNHQ